MDYVAIYSASSTLGKFCGLSLPAPVDVMESSFRVVFKSDANTQSTGFLIRYGSSEDDGE